MILFLGPNRVSTILKKLVKVTSWNLQNSYWKIFQHRKIKQHTEDDDTLHHLLTRILQSSSNQK